MSKASNDRGELVGKELEAIATITYDEAKNIVTLEISDKDVLETLKGSKVTLVLYTNFREGTDFAQFATGVPNTAKVSFNDKSKTTNKVVVTPPVPVTPPAPNIPPAEGDIPKNQQNQVKHCQIQVLKFLQFLKYLQPLLQDLQDFWFGNVKLNVSTI